MLKVDPESGALRGRGIGNPMHARVASLILLAVGCGGARLNASSHPDADAPEVSVVLDADAALVLGRSDAAESDEASFSVDLHTTAVDGDASTGSGDTGAGEVGTASCDDLRAAARAELDRLVAANQSCGTDEDCTTLWDPLGCIDYCSSRDLNRAGVAAAADAGTKLCVWLTSQGCALSDELPGFCPNVIAACRDGGCRSVPP
jgi:hypothetical protein